MDGWESKQEFMHSCMHASANTSCMRALWVWGVDGSRMEKGVKSVDG